MRSSVRRVVVERMGVVSSFPFEVVVARLEAAVGHPDMNGFVRAVAASKTYAELEGIVNEAAGSSGLMEMARFDLGEVLRKGSGADAPKVLRLVIGNPLVMKQMVERVPDAGSYAPVTVLVDQRSDGVHLS